MEMRSTLSILFLNLWLLLTTCNSSNNDTDAQGSFEAQPVTVSAQNGGLITSLELEEGKNYPEGKTVGWTDTSQLHLTIEKLRAKREALYSRESQIDAQLKVIREQMEQLSKERKRFESLLKAGGATGKQVEDLAGQWKVLNRKLEATQSESLPVEAEIRALNTEITRVRDKIDKSRILIPTKGTVLDKFKEEGEFVAPGMPVFRMASLDHLDFKAFVTATQLPGIHLGQKVTVLIDKNEEEYFEFPGIITHIADEAEFTPKNVLTKKERANLVYAIKIRVKNDGRLKIGMPGEVSFNKPKEVEK